MQCCSEFGDCLGKVVSFSTGPPSAFAKSQSKLYDIDPKAEMGWKTVGNHGRCCFLPPIFVVNSRFLVSGHFSSPIFRINNGKPRASARGFLVVRAEAAREPRLHLASGFNLLGIIDAFVSRFGEKMEGTSPAALLNKAGSQNSTSGLLKAYCVGGII